MSINITAKQIKHIASLARIKLSESEVKKFRVQLKDIVSYFDKLNEVDTTGIEPTSQVTGLKNRLRKDEIIHFLKRERALQNAPVKKKGYFVTKSSLKKDAKN
ncbi:MAG: Asp-tRNA(Asn)/Glu-tRNA(Gln) amidotransferase subunit GatC [Patescibacteria group bacterium]|nr:Asp-tRNA(Asn)/Glu-tRNA(Gln) amidotransferase subunit GatC [Patescibacteria group bacterium]